MSCSTPLLIVTIDTECDKSANWRTADPLGFRGVTHAIPSRLQPLFARTGIRPTYLLSPEVMTDPESCQTLRSLSGVELASHLHGDYMVPHIKTWDYAGTITDEMQWEYPPELERAKLAALTELFHQQFGRLPTSFRAGRFGIGPHTGRWLRELGYLVDSSVTPHICWTSRHGVKRPDFRGFPERPYTVAPEGSIATPGKSDFLEVPVTILPPGTVPANNGRDPIWFRPWYSDGETLCHILRHVADGKPENGLHRPLVMMFHNVELMAGASPYPQTEADVERYLQMMARVFELAAQLGIQSCTLTEYYQRHMDHLASNPARATPYSVCQRVIGSSAPCSPEVNLPVALVEAALARHRVEPWFSYAFRQRSARWDCWRPCEWVLKHFPKDAPVLSLGAGVGFNLFWLAQHGFSDLLGLDLDPAAIAAGQEIAREAGLPVHLWVDDALKPQWLPAKKFGVIEALIWVCLAEEFPLAKVLERYLPHLAAGGVFIVDIIDAAYNSWPDNQYHTQDRDKPMADRRGSEYKHRFTEPQVRQMFEDKRMTLTDVIRESTGIPKTVYVAAQQTVAAPPMRVPPIAPSNRIISTAAVNLPESLPGHSVVPRNRSQAGAAIVPLTLAPERMCPITSPHNRGGSPLPHPIAGHIAAIKAPPCQSAPQTRILPPRITTGRPHILLIADVPNWIFERHARTLHGLLSGTFQFTLAFQNQTFKEEDFDLIYPLEFNLVPASRIGEPGKYVTGIRSHLTWQSLEFQPLARQLAQSFRRVHVVSRRLQKIFQPLLPEVELLSHGVNTSFFTPATTAGQSGTRLRLGWAGNRLSASRKGFKEIIEPLGKLPGVELVFCGYSDRNLSFEQMRDFYNSLDGYVCASDVEGNNNSLLEAAAMQRAIITTDNGAVPEYLTHDHNALIVKRKFPAFAQAVKQLRDDPERRIRLGAAARESVKSKFEWRVMAERYKDFFLRALEQKSEPSSDVPAQTGPPESAPGWRAYCDAFRAGK